LGSTEISNTTSWSNTSIKFSAPATIGTHNVQVEVNGVKSNIVQLVIQSDTDFATIRDCKFIDISVPLYGTFETTNNNNGNITKTTREEYINIDYDFQSTEGQNEITFTGLGFIDSSRVTEGDGTIRTAKISGSFSSDYSKITSITYSYERKKQTNDTNFAVTKIECVINNIPFTSKNPTSTQYNYGSYANQGECK
jgi:hypothetical protein